MTKFTRPMLIELIKDILVRLWLYDEVGTPPSGDTKSRAEILKSASELAANVLGATEGYEDEQLNRMLIDVYDMKTQSSIEAEQTLHHIMSKLAPDGPDLTDQEKLNAIETQALAIAHKIEAKSSFDQAKQCLTHLSQLTTVAARLAFAGNAQVSENMDVMLRDFEHADEDVVLRSIYQDIRKGNYPLLRSGT
jgi:hypothetical protein